MLQYTNFIASLSHRYYLAVDCVQQAMNVLVEMFSPSRRPSCDDMVGVDLNRLSIWPSQRQPRYGKPKGHLTTVQTVQLNQASESMTQCSSSSGNIMIRSAVRNRR